LITNSAIVVKRFVIALFLSLHPVLAIANAPLIIRPTVEFKSFNGIRPVLTQTKIRPKIGLVLSGGGSRGLAQIGVLRVLEDRGIPIDCIVGTSLGSVVGGLYAAGYTTTELESIAVNTDWPELLSFSEETKRTQLFVGQKQSQSDGYLVIRFNGLAPIIPSSISSGQRLTNLFSYLALQALYHPNPAFDDLRISFRAVATDLVKGERYVFDRGSLAEAMRACVTVPLLYSPVERGNASLVDGGLTSNVPVDVARSLGCEVVIVVNSTSPMRKADQLNAPWEIADQIMTIMMQEANARQLASADVVITPALGDRIASDFSDIDSVIVSGERAAREQLPSITAAIFGRRDSLAELSNEPFQEPEISFGGNSIHATSRQAILDEATQRLLSPRRIQHHINLLAMTGLYRDLYAEISEPSAPTRVVFHASAQPVVNRIDYSGNTLVPDSAIDAFFETPDSGMLGYFDIQRAFERTLAEYRRAGYALARIESVSVDPVRGTLHFTINEGTIQQIRYEGNDHTKDYIIRREFPINDGDVFNIDRAAQGVANVRSTGLFEYVLLDVRYVDNQPILVVKVKERSAELLRLGLHVDNEHNVVTTVNMRDGNFRGAWEDLGITLRYGARIRSAQADYTVNRLLHSYLTLNLRSYFKSRDILTYQDRPGTGTTVWERDEAGRFRESKYGASLSFGSHFERLGDLNAEVRAEHHHIGSISGTGYGPADYRFVSLKLQSTVDTENEFSFPTEGMFLVVSYEMALQSWGSEISFGKVGATYETYLSPFKRHTLRPKVTFGFADATLPLAEQFSLGGFRSFYGLRDDDSRGRQLLVFNTEYRYWLPFKIIFETYIKVRYDLGTISLVPQELKLANFRHAVGAEIALGTPIGPVSVGMGKSFFVRRDLPAAPISVGPMLFYFSIGPPL
jgi:NTE family protein